MRNNPFIPGDPIIEKAKFFGRKEELELILDCITNKRNVIITGDRGIGKTSIANQVIEYLDTNSKGIVSSFSCIRETNMNDICEGLLNSLKRKLVKYYPQNESSLKVKFEIPKFLSIEETITQEKNLITGIVNRFIDSILLIANKFAIKEKTICFYIDEIDVLSEHVDISSFIKTVKEHLQREDIVNISFLLVGQRGHIHKLIEKHPSIGRTLTTVVLPLMERNELFEIIDKAEFVSNVKFDDGVKRGIVDLSNGFPSVTQFLCYYAFYKDRDNFVDYFDFENGLNLAIEKLNFEKYIDPVKNSDDKLICKLLLEKICATSNENISISNMSSILGVSKERINESLHYLYEQGLIFLFENETFSLKDRLIGVYYKLKTLNKRTTEFIGDIIREFQAKGYSTRYVGSPTQRNLDIIASKKIRFFYFFKSERKIGVICMPNESSLSEDFLDYYQKNIRTIYKNNNLDEVMIIGKNELMQSIKLKMQSYKILNYMTLSMLKNWNIDNY